MSSKEVNNRMYTAPMSDDDGPDWPGYREAEASTLARKQVVYVPWFWGPMPPMPGYITKTQKGRGKGMQVCVRTTIPSQNK